MVIPHFICSFICERRLGRFPLLAALHVCIRVCAWTNVSIPLGYKLCSGITEAYGNSVLFMWILNIKKLTDFQKSEERSAEKVW